MAPESFKIPKVAISRIWQRIQSLGDAAQPAKQKADRKAKRGAQAAKGASAKSKATKKATVLRWGRVRRKYLNTPYRGHGLAAVQ